MFERLTRQYGERGEVYLTGFDRPETFRVNSLKSTRERVERELDSRKIPYRGVPWYRDAFIVPRGSGLAESELFRAGEIYLQSLSSMMPPLLLNAAAGESVLDMTAAPGGKTTQICALTEGRALVTACERDKFRYERLRFNLERQGAARVTAIKTDALLLDENFSFDKILLDAPCSGSGTYTPASRPRLTEEYLQKCVQTQEKLLKKAYKLLKRGGRLVYSTCSIFPEENGDHFVRLPSEMRLKECRPFEGVPYLPSLGGTLQIEPTELYEGFFLAVLEKR